MIALLLLGQASAYDLNGSSWPGEDPVEPGFHLNIDSFPSDFASHDEVQWAWDLSRYIWSVQGKSGVFLRDGGHTNATQYGGGADGFNTTMYNSFKNGSTLGMATYNFIGDEMTNCDIRMYQSNWYGEIEWSFRQDGAASGEYDFAHTLIHEMGHCLGMSHSEYSDAIMYGSNGSGTGWEKRNLTPDDRQGIQAIYGRVNSELSVELSAEPNDDLTPGRQVTITATVDNLGTGRAFDVIVAATADSLVDIEQDQFEQPVLEIGSDTFVFTAFVAEDCDVDGTATFTVAVDEVNGGTADSSIDLNLGCADALADGDPDGGSDGVGGESAGGCGCNQTAPIGSLAMLLGLLGLVRRRR